MTTTQLQPAYRTITPQSATTWLYAGKTSQFPPGVGGTVKHGPYQIAVFYFGQQKKWYACQNLCPHKLENVLGRGLTGEQSGIPKIACPLHKRAFSLETGDNLNGDCPPLAIYPVRVENGKVYVGFAD